MIVKTQENGEETTITVLALSEERAKIVMIAKYKNKHLMHTQSF